MFIFLASLFFLQQGDEYAREGMLPLFVCFPSRGRGHLEVLQ